ncbi:hypothetical protein GINT2_000526 [Glugoides intestinalis]
MDQKIYQLNQKNGIVDSFDLVKNNANPNVPHSHIILFPIVIIIILILYFLARKGKIQAISEKILDSSHVISSKAVTFVTQKKMRSYIKKAKKFATQKKMRSYIKKAKKLTINAWMNLVLLVVLVFFQIPKFVYNLIFYGNIESVRKNSDYLVKYIQSYSGAIISNLYDLIRNDVVLKAVNYINEKEKYELENTDPHINFRANLLSEEINKIKDDWGSLLNEFKNIDFPIATDELDFTNFWLINQNDEPSNFNNSLAFRRTIPMKEHNPFFTKSPLFFIIANAYRNLHKNFKENERSSDKNTGLNKIDMTYKRMKKVLNDIGIPLNVKEEDYNQFIKYSIDMIIKFNSFDLYFQENLWHNFFKLVAFIKLFIIYRATTDDLFIDNNISKMKFLKDFADGTINLTQFETNIFPLVNINLDIKPIIIRDIENHTFDSLASNLCFLEVTNEGLNEIVLVKNEKHGYNQTPTMLTNISNHVSLEDNKESAGDNSQ